MAGLLGDIYSAGDTLKRRLRGLLDDPMGTIGLGVTRMGEDQRGLLNLMANAYPRPGDRTVLNSPEQIDRMRSEFADKATEQAIAGMFVGPGKQPFVYPQDKALAKAQRNASLPVEQGGLGLGPNNTPMERARAMGFEDDAYHGTPDDRIARTRQFKDEMLGKTTRVSDAKLGHFTVGDGKAASEYIWRDGSTDGGNVLPLKLAGDRARAMLPGEWQSGRFDSAISNAKNDGFDGLTIQGTTTLGRPGDYQVTFAPKNIRSRFAAFDPMRRNEADLLGRADPALLAAMAGTGLLGLGAYGASKDR